MTVDKTRIRVVAVGNRQMGYVGQIEIGFQAGLIPFGCTHRHAETGEARDCVRKMTWRLLDDHANPPDPELGAALVRWYDTTHGNGFGHDHHCRAPYSENPYTQAIFDGCTCGWSDVQRAEQKRSEEGT